VPFKGKWNLYYGAADHVIGRAQAPMPAASPLPGVTGRVR
jgi:predicted GH43/DUF377 family glycosyl hydrolase